MTTIPESTWEEARALFEERLNGMMLTRDHSFGLMDEDAKERARMPFRQLGQHDIIPMLAHALHRARQEATAWRPIDQHPETDGPLKVLLFSPGMRLDDFEGCDYSMSFGVWDRTRHADIFSGWFDQGTNHDCFEHLNVEDGTTPTHWMPAPDEPAHE